MKSYTAVQTSETAEGVAPAPAPASGSGVEGLNELESGQHRSASSSNADNNRVRAPTYTPDAPDNAPTVLTFTNITVTTKNAMKKTLLNNVSGSITGGFWAIMGASGGGKTTLLSTLSLRLDTNSMNITGEFRLNGREYSRRDLKSMSAYVMQDDLLHGELTVYETLSYGARLRMRGDDITNEIRSQRVEYVLALMEIGYCRDVIIGDSRRTGISGSERKRVSVALELLNRPKLLFLDEPTSGLDSTTSFSVTKTLKHLSEIGECTVVCTIHQPMPKIFRLFDNLILMAKGMIVYQGQAAKSVKFLDTIGLPCPKNANLADHLINVASPPENTDGTTGDSAAPLDNQFYVPVDLSLGIEKPFYTQDGARNWFYEFYVLFQRSFQQYYRKPDIILMNLVATIAIAVFIGFGFWHDIGTIQSSVRSYKPSLFFVMVNSGVVASLQAISSFPKERAIVLRERAAGTYHVSSYFMAKTVVDMISATWPPIIFSCIVYWGIGYQPIASKFFMYLFFIILNTLAATSLGCLVVCVCVSIERSTIVLSFLFEICRLFGGLYISPAQLVDYPDWKFADVLSYIKYAYVGVALNELTGLDFDTTGCTKGCVANGETVIELNGYDEYTVSECIASLIAFIVGFRLLAFLALRFLKS